MHDPAEANDTVSFAGTDEDYGFAGEQLACFVPATGEWQSAQQRSTTTTIALYNQVKHTQHNIGSG